MLLGVQLCCPRFSIDDCSGKWWSKEAHQKCHTISLDICEHNNSTTLVNLCLHHKSIRDRRCEFSSRILVICGKLKFSAFIWRKLRLRLIEWYQVITARLLLGKERVVNDFIASRAVILLSRTGMAVEKRIFSKIPNWRHYLLKTHAKRKKNWQNHWEWLNKPFQNASKPWEWFKGKEIGFRMSWSREMLKGFFLLVNSCFKDRTEYSLCQGYALHLMGPARCGVLWAVETEWNHHRASVANVIDAFEPYIEGETATVSRETRQSYPPAWQCSATCRKTGQDILENAEMGGLTQPTLLFRRCSFRLPFVSIDGTRPGLSAFPFLWRSQKMDWFLDRLKTHRFFEMVPNNCQKDGKSSG